MKESAETLLKVVRIIEEYGAKKLLLCDVEARVKYELALVLAPGALKAEP